MQSNASSTSKVFLAVIVLSGLAVLTNGVLHPSSANLARFLSFLLVACVAARLKVKLPGLTGNMSVNLPFILVAAAELSSSEALAIACLSTLVQCLPGGKQKFNMAQIVFNFSNMALAVGATRLALRSTAANSSISSHAVLLLLSAAAFFVVNTAPVAIIISFTEAKNALKVWGNIFQLSFPYFVLSTAVAALILITTKHLGWQPPVLVLPVMFGVFSSYKRYFSSESVTPPLPLTKAVAAS
jgi:hypothetical protein